MYCTAPLSPRKWRLRSFRDDDDDGDDLSLIMNFQQPRKTRLYYSQSPPWLAQEHNWCEACFYSTFLNVFIEV